MRIAELREKLDAAGTEDAPSCREALAAAVHALARATVGAAAIARDVADDLASDVAVAATSRIEAGEVLAGREDAFVRACAKNRARDHHRGRSGVFVVAAQRAAFDDDRASDAPTPEALLLALEEARLRDLRLALVRTVIAEAPPRYRAVLEAVYLRGEPIDALVDGAVGPFTAPSERRRARNAVDKTLERARAWVRQAVRARVVTTIPDLDR